MAITVPVFQVDAFTRQKFSGNPAGVVLDADALSTEQMQLIAREFNNGDTVFALRPEARDHDVRVRFFTPRSEAAFVGHATLALHAVLAAQGHPAAPRQMQKSGPVTVRVAEDDGLAMVTIAQRRPSLRDAPAAPMLADALAALGISEPELDPAAPPVIAGAASTRLLLAVRTADTLARLQPDLQALTALSPRIGAPGYFVYTRQSSVPETDTEARMFCPALGIPEDPVSGNAHSMLGAWLWECGLLRPAGSTATRANTCGFTGAQGHYVQRPGQVRVQLQFDGNALGSVSIGGNAVIVFASSISV